MFLPCPQHPMGYSYPFPVVSNPHFPKYFLISISLLSSCLSLGHSSKLFSLSFPITTSTHVSSLSYVLNISTDWILIDWVMPIDAAPYSLLYTAVWYTHFSGILSVKGPNSNRSRYAHLWRADCVRGSSISCHTVAVPIMLKKVKQILNVPQYNEPRSGSQQWHMPPYFPTPNLLCLLQHIPLEVNLVYKIIKINFICWRPEPSNDFNTAERFLNELPSKSSLIA